MNNIDIENSYFNNLMKTKNLDGIIVLESPDYRLCIYNKKGNTKNQEELIKLALDALQLK